jgi:hypothetical protein
MLNAQTFEAKSWVWVHSDADMFLPAQVTKSFKPGEEGNVKYEDGKVRLAAPRVLPPVRSAKRTASLAVASPTPRFLPSVRPFAPPPLISLHPTPSNSGRRHPRGVDEGPQQVSGDGRGRAQVL